MSKIRSVLLCVAVALTAFALIASVASAEILFEWKVAGALLKEGETLGFTVNNDSKKFTLSANIGGVVGSLLSSNASVLAGAKIIGGVPGTNEETVVFKEITSDGGLEKCGVLQVGAAPGVLTTTPLKAEIVEGAVAGVGNNEALILFTPKVSEGFATFQLTGASCPFSGQELPLTGLILALPLPQKTEVLRQNLVFEAVTKEYKNFKKEFKKAGLFIGANTATISGLTLVVLDHDEIYAPF